MRGDGFGSRGLVRRVRRERCSSDCGENGRMVKARVRARARGHGGWGFPDVWSERVEKGGWDSCM